MANNDYTTVDKIILDSSNQLEYQKVVINGKKVLGDIRTFVDSQDYTGYTKKGIQFTLKQLRDLKEITSKLKDIDEKEKSVKIDQINVSDSTTIVIQIQNNKYTNFKPLIDIRTHIDSENFTGFTKKGFRIPPDSLDEFNSKLNNLISEIENENNLPSESKEDSSMVSKLKKEMI